MTDIVWNGPQMIAAIRGAIAPEVLAGGHRVHETAVRSIMTGPKTGRIYRRRNVVHQASAPGEPPASDTGTLVQRSTVEWDQNDLRATVVFRTKYAEYLELGTERMEPRPFLRQALAQNIDAITARINAAIARVLRDPRAGGMG